MTSENPTNKKGTKYLQIVLVSLLILASLIYFGNFWLKALKKDQTTESVLSAQEVSTPDTAQTPLSTVSNKTKKPVVELFVMSHCPYGTQMEKAIIPALKTLGDSVDFQLKFVNYAMHGKPELDEQLSEFCIQKEQPDKLISYLECFLEDGDSQKCVDSTGLNQELLNTCIKSSDEEFAVTKSFEDKSTWKSGSFPPFLIYEEENKKYGVAGSPTFVVNGEMIQPSSRTPKALLDTICSAFTNAPEECSQELSTEVPIPGFGWESSAADSSDASCN